MTTMKTIIALVAAGVVVSLIAAIPLFHSSFASTATDNNSNQQTLTSSVQNQEVQGYDDGETNDGPDTGTTNNDNGSTDSYNDGEQQDD
jgi:hypothetical protein